MARGALPIRSVLTRMGSKSNVLQILRPARRGRRAALGIVNTFETAEEVDNESKNFDGIF